MAVSEIKRQEKYEMKIYADNVISTDERFTMDNLNAGNNYKTLSAVFEVPTVGRLLVITVRASGEIPTRLFRRLPVRFLRNSLRSCLLRRKGISRYADSKRRGRWFPESTQAWQSLGSIVILLNI